MNLLVGEIARTLTDLCLAFKVRIINSSPGSADAFHDSALIAGRLALRSCVIITGNTLQRFES